MSQALTEKGHPKGLYLLFGVEAWERFSFYGMRALLMLYMTKLAVDGGLGFSTQTGGRIYGLYTGLVYLTPLLGGYIADRWLGARRCILIGGILMALGHFAMAFPPLPFFFSALTLLIFGNGFFKPNISTIVGKLYEQDDPRRDGGFTIFYMGINLGAFFSPLVCGTLAEVYGWHYGFAAAGVGMVLGLTAYLIWGQKFLGDKGKAPVKEDRKVAEDRPLTKKERQQTAVILLLSFFSIFFWMSFEQAGSSLTLFADRSTDRMIPFLNVEFPVTWFQAVNPLMIFILAPIFAKLWTGLAAVGREPSTPLKFAAGLGLVAVGFVVMLAAAALYTSSGPVGLFWLLAVYLLHTLGELCLSPVGLSMVTKLAPLKFASLLMGSWFFAAFVAEFCGGFLAGNYDDMTPTTFFLIPTITSGVAALIVLFFVPRLKQWMHGVN